MCRSAESGGGRKRARPFVSRLTGDHLAAPPGSVRLKSFSSGSLLFRHFTKDYDWVVQTVPEPRPLGGAGPAGPMRLMVEWSALCARLLWDKNSEDPKEHKDFRKVGGHELIDKAVHVC